jgi:hypothetical protein
MNSLPFLWTTALTVPIVFLNSDLAAFLLLDLIPFAIVVLKLNMVQQHGKITVCIFLE